MPIVQSDSVSWYMVPFKKILHRHIELFCSSAGVCTAITHTFSPRMLLSHVLLQVLRPFKALPADVAAEGAILGVGGEVTLQLVLAGALAPAYMANVSLLRASQQQRATRGDIQGAAAQNHAGFLQLACMVYVRRAGRGPIGARVQRVPAFILASFRQQVLRLASLELLGVLRVGEGSNTNWRRPWQALLEVYTLLEGERRGGLGCLLVQQALEVCLVTKRLHS